MSNSNNNNTKKRYSLDTKIYHLKVLKNMIDDLANSIYKGLEDKKNENRRNSIKKNKP